MLTPVSHCPDSAITHARGAVIGALPLLRRLTRLPQLRRIPQTTSNFCIFLTRLSRVVLHKKGDPKYFALLLPRAKAV